LGACPGNTDHSGTGESTRFFRPFFFLPPMKFNRHAFFDKYREHFGRLSQIQVTGISQLLDFLEADRYIQKIPYASYIFATTKHETADTYHPIHEYGPRSYFIKRYGGQTKKGKELGNDTPEEGYYYAGKGYPQTTGESNYEKAEDAIRDEYPDVVAEFERRTGKKFDLTVGDQPDDEADPLNMMDPAIAYVTMSHGMRKGMFTGHKFSDHLDEIPPDYKNARKIINGLDKAGLIAGYANQFETILRASKDSASVLQPPALTDQPIAPTSGQPSDIAGADFTEGERPIHIKNIENVDTKPAPPPPSDTPATVTVERVSIWTKIGMGVAGLTGIGINFGNVVSTKLNEMTVTQLGYVLGGLVLLGVALLMYDKAAKRAHEKTLAKMRTAADPSQTTVELREQKP
jgi:putative chitinase